MFETGSTRTACAGAAAKKTPSAPMAILSCRSMPSLLMFIIHQKTIKFNAITVPSTIVCDCNGLRELGAGRAVKISDGAVNDSRRDAARQRVNDPTGSQLQIER